MALVVVVVVVMMMMMMMMMMTMMMMMMVVVCVQGGLCLSVMSFNVLAPGLCTREAFPAVQLEQHLDPQRRQRLTLRHDVIHDDDDGDDDDINCLRGSRQAR
jgi:hypothetical protein